ncbi:MAG: hypothetical protein UU95_C0004G0014 [Parcubacteria group bacterium GW2011_GWC2_42_12]|uniref:Uncharacterized protein n=2 Tax=Candidatus Falkowiibacteriota TaxID=1752728 RepID=A0A1F5S9X4_9BACT|nr:MAG: hypothetical protein UU43_C0003G0014 [Candidatus Falkowbacteria bacterium GW2011_GWA2_41_14]KKS35131.1 MAG: hypothetical protein UU95_C0004G0014 [Parcubacteria group bacterium GW2011_GWC2_42_12]OGF23362.1 MAG: hypothetical protein A3D45_03165 [Candidatus Falkowbacteria bacterium RIFCSPHIGHO2_02_FULL_42_9]
MENDNVKLKIKKEIAEQGGFALILIIITILIIAVIAFGTISWKGQVQQSQEIKNKAVDDLKAINENLNKYNQQIQNNLEDKK